MKRLAILIEASDVIGQGNLLGAKADIDNWKSYLKSNNGGCWRDDEIETFNKPSAVSISLLLKNNEDKYCFVVFSGHGYHNKETNITNICLNDKEQNVPITRIKPKSEKGILIIDSCRGYETPDSFVEFCDFSLKAPLESLNIESHRSISRGFSEKISDKTFVNISDKYPVKLHENISDKNLAESCRNIWNDALVRSQNGIVIMYATSEGQGATEYVLPDGSAGGYFTTVLINTARDWAKENDGKQCLNSKEAFDRAKKDLISYVHPRQQSPEYTADKKNLHFPFAVKTF